MSQPNPIRQSNLPGVAVGDVSNTTPGPTFPAAGLVPTTDGQGHQPNQPVALTPTTVQQVGAISGPITFNNPGAYACQIVGPTAFTLTTGTSGQEAIIELFLTTDATGGYALTWPGTVTWGSGGAQGPIAANGRTYVKLITTDAGAHWYGSH